MQGVVKIMTHAIFGVNGADTQRHTKSQLEPTPQHMHAGTLCTPHPSQAISVPVPHIFKFRSRIKWTKEQQILIKNNIGHPNRTKSTSVGVVALEWGTWFEFNGDGERITNAVISISRRHFYEHSEFTTQK